MLLNEDKIDLIENIAKNKIDEAIENITNAKFDINPKFIDKSLVGCSYCKFKDICYKKYEDTVFLDPKEKLFVEEGDKDAMDE